MQRCKLTDFGLLVKTELLKRGMEQKDLINKVNMESGMFIDNGYLHKILTGQRKAPKIVSTICKILELDNDVKSTA